MPKIHPKADVQSKNIGSGTQIWQFSVVLKDAQIGSDCNINCQVFIENDVVIGNEVTVKSGVQLWDGIRIEDRVFIGPNATFTNDLMPRSKQYPEAFEQTILKTGCSIGANATLIAGIEIGQFAMVGAGAVVTKSVPDFALVVGNPARHKGYITKTGQILDLNLKSKSGQQFQFKNADLIPV
ncbi:MAG: acyltransferase [Flavobacteriales bacterium]